MSAPSSLPETNRHDSLAPPGKTRQYGVIEIRSGRARISRLQDWLSINETSSRSCNTRRCGKGRTNAPRVKIAFSQDAGATFSRPIQVDDGENVGRVDTLLLPDGSALVCWLAGTVEGGAIKVRRVRANGSVGPAAVIAQTDISRSSGFPRMARLGDQVHFAWTEFGKPSRVRTALADVAAYK